MKTQNSGTAALEFSLVVPVLLFLSLGIVDLGRLGFTKASLDWATQNRARCEAIQEPQGPDAIPCTTNAPGIQADLEVTKVKIGRDFYIQVQGVSPFWPIIIRVFPNTIESRALYPLGGRAS